VGGGLHALRELRGPCVRGALLENNRALGRRAHRSWFAALVLTGPLAMLLYWALHVWPAPYVPRRDRD
jgi:hypothetical protein